MQITTLGIDVAKNVFQLHGVDARGRAVLSRRVKRQQLLDTVANLPACVIGMEACGSAQHWGRAFEQLGHTVKLGSLLQRSKIARLALRALLGRSSRMTEVWLTQNCMAMAHLLSPSLQSCFISWLSFPAILGRPCGFPSFLA